MIGTLKGKFPFRVEKHLLENRKPVCSPGSVRDYVELTAPGWRVTCKQCLKIIEAKK